jgi:hypothetical protein
MPSFGGRSHVQENCALHGSNYVGNGAVAQCTATAFAGPALAGQAHDLAKDGRGRNEPGALRRAVEGDGHDAEAAVHSQESGGVHLTEEQDAIFRRVVDGGAIRALMPATGR